MSWIKDNKFVVALAGGTLVGAILIFLVGFNGRGRYNQAKTEFDTAAAEASSFESLALYPRPENRDGKDKALVEYRQAAESLQAAFESFRPKKQELDNVSPQDFTTQLKAVNDEVRKAFEESGTKVPETFFCGFENYKTILAPGAATGILGFELTGIKKLMLALAKSGATEFKNLYRPLLSEESGKVYKPLDSDVARPLPLELTFSGPEKAVRAMLSAILKQQGSYFVIRSMCMTNAKKDPPRATDAKFDKPAAPAPAAGGDVFSGGGFVLPGEEPKADDKAKVDDKKKPAGSALVPTPAPAPTVIDSSRILSQVLGNEEVQVFLRLDLMLFLPAKKLP